MPSDRVRGRLIDIRDHILLAQGFTSGMSAEQLSASPMALLATIRCLEVISEASRHIDEATKLRHPNLPWAAISGAGNVYRHDYPHVRPDLVWGTVNNQLPALLAAVEAELRA